MRYPTLLANVRLIMEEREWDQSVLADNVGTSQGTVSRWGTLSTPRGQSLAKLAEIAGVSPTEMLNVPLKQARRHQRLVLPSGRKLVETMEALLDNAGLPHLVDEYAEKLARILPTLIEASASPLTREGLSGRNSS